MLDIIGGIGVLEGMSILERQAVMGALATLATNNEPSSS
jgi:hypothetical protein